MPKKKKKKKKKRTRTSRCYLAVPRNSVQYHHLRHLTRKANSLYNCSLFVRRQYYRIACAINKTFDVSSQTSMTLHDIIQLIKIHSNDDLMLKSLYVLLSKKDFDYVYDMFIPENDILKGTCSVIQNTLMEYRKNNATKGCVDSVVVNLERNTTAMGFEDMLTTLTSVDRHSTIGNDSMIQTQLDQLIQTLTSVVACKVKKAVVATATDTTTTVNTVPMKKNLLLPTYLHKDIAYAMVKDHQTVLYKSLPSQVAQYIAREAVDAAYVSYFEAKKNNIKAKAPKYLDKNGFYPLTWAKTTFKFITNGKRQYVRLSLGNNSIESFEDAVYPKSEDGQLHNMLSKSKYEGVLCRDTKSVSYRPRKGCLRDPEVSKTTNANTVGLRSLRFRCGSFLDNTDVAQIRLVPKRNGTIFELQYVKTAATKPVELEPVKRLLAIDFGVVNVVTAVTNVAGLRPWIIGGKELTHLNKRFEKCIGAKQRSLEQAHATKKSHALHRLWYRREQCHRNIMHCIAKRVVDYCQRFNINKIVAGYNINWKTKVNMGTQGNKRFYQIPYNRIVNYLFDKAEAAGIDIDENEEAYTSKCDALELEDFDVCKTRCRSETFKNRRIHRGLYASKSGRLINADVNGALNIMRKHVIKAHNYLLDQVNNLIRNAYTFLSPIKFSMRNIIGTTLQWDAFAGRDCHHVAKGA